MSSGWNTISVSVDATADAVNVCKSMVADSAACGRANLKLPKVARLSGRGSLKLPVLIKRMGDVHSFLAFVFCLEPHCPNMPL